MDFSKDFNLFVGGKPGVFKGIKVNDKATIVKNLQNVETLCKENEITAMEWGDDNEEEILLGLAKQVVKIYDTQFNAFVGSIEVKCGEGPIKGIYRHNGALLTAVESGQVKTWRCRKKDESGNVIETNGNICKMRHSSFNPEICATGGCKNDLKLWNIENSKCVFAARNVRPDFLHLAVPVWVTDMCFTKNADVIATSTRYGEVRLYDIRVQRRPVFDMNVYEDALTAISTTPSEHEVIVGSATGRMCQIDFRSNRILRSYKGAVGSIRSIICPESQSYVASVGLDKFLRIHDTKDKNFVFKKYMKSTLNCVLMRRNFSPFDDVVEAKKENIQEKDKDSKPKCEETVCDNEDKDDVVCIKEENIPDKECEDKGHNVDAADELIEPVNKKKKHKHVLDQDM